MHVSEKLIRALRGLGIVALSVASNCLIDVASAQTTYYTDFNGATAGFGTNANLTWSTGSAIWTTNVGGTVAAVAWPAAAANNNAVLGHGSGTGPFVATLGSAISVGNISVTNGTWTVNTNANALTFNGTTNVTPAVTFNGTGSITKNNTNIVTLSGANSYTGNTTVNAGTLAFGDNSAAGTGTIFLNAGAIQASGAPRTLTNALFLNATSTVSGSNNIVLGTLTNSGATGTRAVTVSNTGTTTFGAINLSNNTSSRTVAFNGTGATVVSGAIAGSSANATQASALTYNGTGSLTLNGTNTYSGTTTLSSGTLNLGSNSAVGTGGLTLNGGNVTAVGGARSLANNITLGGSVTIGGAENLTLSGTFLQTGANRMLTVSNTGLTTFQTGTFTLAESNQARTLTLNVTGSSGGLVISSVIANGAGTGSDSIIKSGSGNLSLTNSASTFNGTTSVNEGRLIVTNLANAASNSSIGTGSGGNSVITLGSGTTTGILSFNGTGTQSTNRQINLGGSTGGGTLEVANTGNITYANATSVTSGVAGTKNLTLAGSGSGTGTISGVIQNGTGLLNLIKDDSSTWVLSGTNTYTGTTSIRNGVLSVNTVSNVGANGALGAPVLANATVSLGNSTNTGTLRFTGTTANSTDRAVSLAGSTGGGAIEVTSSGNLTFTGGLSAAAAGTKNITLNATSTGQGFYNGTISNGSGTVGVIKTGDGTWTLGGSNTFTGTVNVTNGILSLANTGAVASAASLNVESGATLRLASGNATATGTLTINGTGEGGIGAIQGANAVAGFSGNITLAGNSTITSLTSGGTNETVIGQFVSTLARPPVDPTTINLGAHTLTFGGGTGSSIFTLAGKAIGTGGITIDLNNSTDSVYFSAHQNTYTGLTTIKQGTLLPFTLPNTYPGDSSGGGGVDQYYGITGNIQIGDGAGATNTAILDISDVLGSSRTNELINYKSKVTLYSDGQLKVNSAQTFGGYDATYNPGNGSVGDSFIFNGGNVTIGTNGALYLMGDVTVNAAATTATISGTGNTLSLTQHQGPSPVPNANRVFNVVGNGLSSDLTISAKIMNGSITKNGAGIMTITGDNTSGYEGSTTINNGILAITHEGALGQGLSDSASGTFVNSGGTLRLAGTLTLLGAFGVANENLYLNGTGYTSLGALQNESGTNQWSGSVILQSDSSLNATAGLITLAGSVTSATDSTLTVFGSGNTTISGAVGTGNGGIIKQGTGTLILSGANTYAGQTQVQAGVVSVESNNGLGSASGNTTVTSGATLQLKGGITTPDESLTINGTGFGTSGAFHNASGTNVFGGNVTVGTNSGATITSATGTTLTIRGAITGNSTTPLTIGNAANDGIVQMNPASGSISGTVGVTNIAKGTFQVGGTGTSTLNTGEFSSATGTTLIVGSGGTINSRFDDGAITAFDGVVGSGSTGTFALTSTGTTSGLAFNTTWSATSLTLKVGGLNPADTFTLRLGTGVEVTVGTLHITGNTILDFTGSSSTFLSSANLIIDAGVTVTVKDWISGTTFWKVTNTASGITGPGGASPISLPPTQYGTGVLPQITFQNHGAYNYTGLTTTWVAPGAGGGWADKEIRPTPEPATYGAIFLGSCFALLGFRRYRGRRQAATVA
jgi:autotransporter-associated beta strand protein